MHSPLRAPALLATLLLGAAFSSPARGIELLDGDRVVFLGNALFEQEQRESCWETALTSRYPGRNVTFRNLGWTGDTVFGEARAGFGTPADGFRRLKEQVADAKPTVILVGYGGNEAFAGEAGLPHFREGLARLLDTLAETRARVVLVAPLRQEDLARPLPDPAEQNLRLALYTETLRQVAVQRRYEFVNLNRLLNQGKWLAPDRPLTDDEIHLTALGYWRTAPVLERGLGLTPRPWLVETDREGKQVNVRGARVAGVQSGPLRFQVTDDTLPFPPPPEGAPAGGRRLRVRGLPPREYVLKIDGQGVITATGARWESGVPLTRGPEFDQAEHLRRAIVAKNRLYFYRWRPQNETYLFGFRKYEQGQNAKEVAQFDPLVAKVEAEIARLRKPVPHTYELVPEAETKK